METPIGIKCIWSISSDLLNLFYMLLTTIFEMENWKKLKAISNTCSLTKNFSKRPVYFISFDNGIYQQCFPACLSPWHVQKVSLCVQNTKFAMNEILVFPNVSICGVS